jgi:hypothetical protein
MLKYKKGDILTDGTIHYTVIHAVESSFFPYKLEWFDEEEQEMTSDEWKRKWIEDNGNLRLVPQGHPYTKIFKDF